jgi:hypothetical protein
MNRELGRELNDGRHDGHGRDLRAEILGEGIRRQREGRRPDSVIILDLPRGVAGRRDPAVQGSEVVDTARLNGTAAQHRPAVDRNVDQRTAVPEPLPRHGQRLLGMCDAR